MKYYYFKVICLIVIMVALGFVSADLPGVSFKNTLANAKATVKEKAPKPKSLESVVFLSGPNVVILSDRIDAHNVDTVLAALTGKRVMLPKDLPLYLLIASGGGEYEPTKKFIRAIKSIPNLNVICKFCGSSAGLIFATFNTGNRYVLSSSQFMMHEMYIQTFTAEMARYPQIIQSLVDDSEEFNKQLRDLIGISKEEYLKRIAFQEWWLKGDEIVTHKLGDQVISLFCHPYVADLAPNTCADR